MGDRQRATIWNAHRTEVIPGERLVPFYSWDHAECDCAATHAWQGIPCLAVAVRGVVSSRGNSRARGRCLACGTRWIVPDRRRADRTPKGGER